MGLFGGALSQLQSELRIPEWCLAGAQKRLNSLFDSLGYGVLGASEFSELGEALSQLEVGLAGPGRFAVESQARLCVRSYGSPSEGIRTGATRKSYSSRR